MNVNAVSKEKKAHVLLYKKDGSAYALALMSVAAEFVYVVSILDVMPVSFWMGLAIMVNIFMLFMLFTCAVKVNVYEKTWSVITFALGFYMLLRQFVLVPVLLKPYDNHTIILIANLVCAALLFAAGAVSYRKCTMRDKIQAKMESEDVRRNGGK